MIEPFFFGSGATPLFGIYHPPTGGDGRVLTVLCPPFFIEYMRTQLALKALATTLAARGQHVLRFDYRGTGDSFGELEDAAVADWLDDIGLAVREGRDITGSHSVRLLGVRASGLLACTSAKDSHAVDRVVLWDPVEDGKSYLLALRRMQSSIVDLHPPLPRRERREALRECAGYRLSERMREELRALDRSVYESVPQEKLLVVRTSAGDASIAPRACERVIAFECGWETNLIERLLPKTVLECVAECLT